MAMEQCSEKWNDSPVTDDNPTTAFDCNICLDSVQDPVVTLCGHLYCWPCIYKWLHFEDQGWKQHQCPVCKAEVSDATLIPLYGRGVTTKESKTETSRFGMNIPKRPLGPNWDIGTIQRLPNSTNSMQFHHHGYSYQPQVYYPGQDGYPASAVLSTGGMSINVPDPVIRMFGEMVYTRVFGDSDRNFYTYPSSYNLAGITSHRIRRHVMQADKSLGRLSVFLFCCLFLCLLLF
ncbi:E3 ubiquitin-protein ligase RMA1H1-like [Hibiscus syriacus]|uniref:E3 ubiquitin-protein ligase RMA1H1-like n=1 Tax=Hibiscus syriacus TaxID=106335 RepID=UPI001921AEFB|nr:E3 ubiquitin-protein ligase RMA1H1-like [Hibiscus syriacus]